MRRRKLPACAAQGSVRIIDDEAVDYRCAFARMPCLAQTGSFLPTEACDRQGGGSCCARRGVSCGRGDASMLAWCSPHASFVPGIAPLVLGQFHIQPRQDRTNTPPPPHKK